MKKLLDSQICDTIINKQTNDTISIVKYEPILVCKKYKCDLTISIRGIAILIKMRVFGKKYFWDKHIQNTINKLKK